MSPYTVMVDENSHFMEDEERWRLGTFATEGEAIAACRDLVDAWLQEGYRPGMTAKELYDHYTSFGDDPFVIAPPGAAKVEFSAWDYARARADELCKDQARGGADGHA
jgi:hypothetical protein